MSEMNETDKANEDLPCITKYTVGNYGLIKDVTGGYVTAKDVVNALEFINDNDNPYVMRERIVNLINCLL